jgi:hypothetical protein
VAGGCDGCWVRGYENCSIMLAQWVWLVTRLETWRWLMTSLVWLWHALGSEQFVESESFQMMRRGWLFNFGCNIGWGKD